MAQIPEDMIRKSRMLLQNPYAHHDGGDIYDAAFPDRKQDVHEARRTLQNQYAYLDENGGYSEFPGYEERTLPTNPLIDINQIIGTRRPNRRFKRQEIEKLARQLQQQMWRIRSDLLPSRQELNPLELLKPSLALESIGYSIQIEESLGQHSGHGELFEVAGIIDKDHHQVHVSRRFAPEIRNFTMAHELGHAVLHEGTGLHRDRALDGSPSNRTRDPQELEADIFAAYFLLPEKQVRPAFEKMFLTQSFTLDENTAFALTSVDLDSLLNKCRTLRDLTRMLASTERYNGKQVRSLANQFNVSTEAMAIRLEELKLVHF